MPNSEELQNTYGHGWPKTEEYALEIARRVMQLNTLNSYEMVREFHETFGHPVADEPNLNVDREREELRVELIREEWEELQEAVADNDVVAIADALGDLEYVINGMALEYGIDLPAVVAEIHRSNMTKLGPDGKPIYREDGKILKSEAYEQPDLRRVLGL